MESKTVNKFPRVLQTGTLIRSNWTGYTYITIQGRQNESFQFLKASIYACSSLSFQQGFTRLLNIENK